MGNVVESMLDRIEHLPAPKRWEAERLLASLRDDAESVGTLLDFVSRTDSRYRWYTHCQILAGALQQIADGTLNRLMVFMPPRHGKSQLVSRRFPAYYLRKHPDKWVGLASYEATLAQDFSRSCRDAFTMDGGVIRTDSNAVNLWQTPDGGGMWAAGVGGPLTGKGGHLLLIDDPIKNDEEAASETIREKHKSWYDSTFYTRAEPDSAIVVVQTRWNEDDLSGYLLAKESFEPEGWTVLNFPAIAEDAEPKWPASVTVLPDWRKPGEALCPERYGIDALRKIMNRVGSYFWGALYQQRPSPAEGGTFKRAWWKYYDKAPESFDIICQSWDMAFKDTDASDYVVGQVWGVKDADFYLLDQVRDRMDFPQTLMAVRQLTAKWPQATGKFVEDKANGPAVISSLRQKIPGIVAVDPRGGKESRASGVAPFVESGNVYLPEPERASWVSEFVEECAAFPNGVNDDQVDAMSQALTKLGPAARIAVEPPAPYKKPEDKARPYDYDAKQLKREPSWEEYMEREKRRIPSFRKPAVTR